MTLPPPHPAFPGGAWPAVPQQAAAALLAVLGQLEQTQSMSPTALAKARQPQLELLIDHAFEHVVFWRERLEHAGLSPARRPKTGLDPAEWDRRWANLPILTRQEVQEHEVSLRSARLPPGHGDFVDSMSSGSSGRPVRITRSTLDYLYWQAFQLREHVWRERDLAGKFLSIFRNEQRTDNLGNRIVMMNKGRVLHDISGSARENITAEDLLGRFEDLRRREQLGDSIGGLLLGAKGVTELMAIFEAIAGVDQNLDAREIALIAEFSQRWQIIPPDLTEGPVQAPGDILALRECVTNYLRISPPAEQATELLDVLHHFVNADDMVSTEEAIVMDEISAMIMAYVTHSGVLGKHEVVIVPQTSEQSIAIASLLPGIDATSMRGGTVYSVGRFFSAKYAEVVCEKYVALGLFTTRIEV